MHTSNFYRDVITGFFFSVGIFGFIFGEFVLSTLLLGMASLTSNLGPSSSIRA